MKFFNFILFSYFFQLFFTQFKDLSIRQRAAEQVKRTSDRHIYQLSPKDTKLLQVFVASDSACICHRRFAPPSEQLCDTCFDPLRLSFHIGCMDKKFITVCCQHIQQLF